MPWLALSLYGTVYPQIHRDTNRAGNPTGEGEGGGAATGAGPAHSTYSLPRRREATREYNSGESGSQSQITEVDQRGLNPRVLRIRHSFRINYVVISSTDR